jgi:uncharacterized membrane protein YdjX (TVP38/TMEM64 family)
MRLDELSSDGSSGQANPRGLWRPILLATVLVVTFVFFNFYGIGSLGEIQEWIQSFGFWGPVVFFFLYIGLVIATVPGTLLGVIAGGLFGAVVGVILISIASTIGAGITFLIARYFARDAVARWLSKNEKMQRLDELTDKQGMFIVMITRLVPLFPFTLLNYGFGLTKVSFRTYLFWSWLCMLPWTIVFVGGTDAAIQGFSGGGIPWFLVGIVTTTALSMGIIIWYTRRTMSRQVKK